MRLRVAAAAKAAASCGNHQRPANGHRRATQRRMPRLWPNLSAMATKRIKTASARAVVSGRRFADSGLLCEETDI